MMMMMKPFLSLLLLIPGGATTEATKKLPNSPCKLCQKGDAEEFNLDFKPTSPTLKWPDTNSTIIPVHQMDVSSGTVKFGGQGSNEFLLIPYVNHSLSDTPRNATIFMGVAKTDGSDFKCLTCDVHNSMFKCYSTFNGSRAVCEKVAGPNPLDPQAHRSTVALDCISGETLYDCPSDDFLVRPINLPGVPKSKNKTENIIDTLRLGETLQNREYRVSPDGRFLMWTRVTGRQYLMLFAELVCPMKDPKTNLNCTAAKTRVLNPVKQSDLRGKLAAPYIAATSWYELKGFHTDGVNVDFGSSTPAQSDISTHTLNLKTGEQSIAANTLEWDETITFRPYYGKEDDEGAQLVAIGSSMYYGEPARGNQTYMGVLERTPSLAQLTAARLPGVANYNRRAGNQFLNNFTMRQGFLDPWIVKVPNCNNETGFLGVLLTGDDRTNGWESISDYSWSSDGTMLVFTQKCVVSNPNAQPKPCGTNTSRIRIVKFPDLEPVKSPKHAPKTHMPKSWAPLLSEYKAGWMGRRQIYGTSGGNLTVEMTGEGIDGGAEIDYYDYSDGDESFGQTFSGKQIYWFNQFKSTYCEETRVKITTAEGLDYMFEVSVAYHGPNHGGHISIQSVGDAVCSDHICPMSIYWGPIDDVHNWQCKPIRMAIQEWERLHHHNHTCDPDPPVCASPCNVCEARPETNKENGALRSAKNFTSEVKLNSSSPIMPEDWNVAQAAPKFFQGTTKDGEKVKDANKFADYLLFPYKVGKDTKSCMGVSKLDGSDRKCLNCDNSTLACQNSTFPSLFKCYPSVAGTRAVCSSIAGGNNFNPQAPRTGVVIDCGEYDLYHCRKPRVLEISLEKTPIRAGLSHQEREFRGSPDGDYVMWTRVSTNQNMMLLAKLYCNDTACLANGTRVLNAAEPPKGHLTKPYINASAWHEAKYFHWDGKKIDYGSSWLASNDVNTFTRDLETAEITVASATLEWDETITTRPGGGYMAIGSSRYNREPTARPYKGTLARQPMLAAWTVARLPAIVDHIRRGNALFLNNATLRTGFLDPWLVQSGQDCNANTGFLGVHLVDDDRHQGWASISDYAWSFDGKKIIFSQYCAQKPCNETNVTQTRIRIVDIEGLPKVDPPLNPKNPPPTVVPTWATLLKDYKTGWAGFRTMYGTKSGSLEILTTGEGLLGGANIWYRDFSDGQASDGQTFDGIQMLWSDASLNNTYCEETKIIVTDKSGNIYLYRVSVQYFFGAYPNMQQGGYISFNSTSGDCLDGLCPLSFYYGPSIADDMVECSGLQDFFNEEEAKWQEMFDKRMKGERHPAPQSTAGKD